jgi:hypothetical protein
MDCANCEAAFDAATVQGDREPMSIVASSRLKACATWSIFKLFLVASFDLFSVLNHRLG